MLGGKVIISTEDDVHRLGSILELAIDRRVSLVFICFIVLWLVGFISRRRAKCLLQLPVVDCGVLGTWVPRAFLLQELLDLLLGCRLLAMLGTVHIRDELVWLAFPRRTRVVSVAAVVAVIARALGVVSPRESFPHLLFLFGPVMHHITEPCHGPWPVPPKVAINARVGDAIVEGIDDVILRDVGYGGAEIDEAAGV